MISTGTRGLEVQEVQKSDLPQINSSKLTAPSSSYPVYYKEGSNIKILPTDISSATLDYIFKIKSNYNMSSDKHEVDVLDIITQSLPKELEDDSDLKSFEEAVNALDNLKKVDIVDDDKKQDIAIKVSLDKSDPDDANSGNYKILCFGSKWYIVDSNINDTDLKDIVKNLETVFATADPDVE